MENGYLDFKVSDRQENGSLTVEASLVLVFLYL